jgi:hypothetical protein
MSFLSFCQWLAETSWSVGIRESTWTYPIIESVHVLSLCLFLGLAMLWDFRLLGITLKRVPVSEVSARLFPWMVGGFVLMVLSGVGLFTSDPVRFYGNIFFRVKAVALVLAGINAFMFHNSRAGKTIVDWDLATVTPSRAKSAGVISLVLWAVIVVTGRFIAYNWFKPLV